MKLLVLSVLSYFIGCINPAYLIGKKHGMDIRTVGSFNAGASNAAIAFGKKAGIFTALFDMFKSFLCFNLGKILVPTMACAGIVCGTFCLIGHIFPFCLKFHGGKGFASLIGIILAYNYKIFLFLLLCAIIVALVFNYLCAVTTFASLSFPIAYGITSGDIIGTVFIGLICSIIIRKHFENFRRIKLGTECRLTGIFDRDAEEERIRQNSERNI